MGRGGAVVKEDMLLLILAGHGTDGVNTGAVINSSLSVIVFDLFEEDVVNIF